MKKAINITDKWLTCTTGNFFVDTGGLVIKFLRGLPGLKDMDLADLISWMTNVYIDDWDGKLHRFFLNSPITIAAYSTERKKEEVKKYFAELLREKEPNQHGYCAVTGQKGVLFSAGRHDFMLTGSRQLVNFHASLAPGLLVSGYVLIRLFFVPFGVRCAGKDVSVIYSNNILINEHFVYNNCRSNYDRLKKGESKGPAISQFHSPAAVLFDFAYTYIRNEGIEDSERETAISLYQWSNLGQYPHISRWRLEPNVFRQMVISIYQTRKTNL